MLSFQRLDVYRRAIEFLALTTEITESSTEVLLRSPPDGGHPHRAAKLITMEQYDQGIGYLEGVVAMLTKMV